MKQTRRFLMPVEGWDPGAMEEWLEYQAARGWMPVSFGVWYAKFRRSQPRERAGCGWSRSGRRTIRSRRPEGTL